MVETVVDSSMLSCPSAQSTAEDFESWASLLIAWRDLRVANWPRLYFSRNAYGALQETDSFPSWELLKKRLPESAPYLSAKDVFDILNGLLTKVPALEDKIGLHCYEFQNFKSEPDLANLNCHERKKSYLQSLCVASALWSGLHSLPEQQPWILSSLLGSNDEQIVVSGECLYELVQNAGEIMEQPLQNIILRCIDGLQTWTSKLPAEELLSGAVSGDDASRAIHLAVIQMAIAVGIQLPEFQVGWRVGDQFLQTINALHLQNNEARVRGVLRASAETILRRNLAATHWLRVDAGASSKQRTSGDYGAWRRDVDHEFHLHYWQRNDNFIELASVVVHNDMTIPAPD